MPPQTGEETLPRRAYHVVSDLPGKKFYLRQLGIGQHQNGSRRLISLVSSEDSIYFFVTKANNLQVCCALYYVCKQILLATRKVVNTDSGANCLVHYPPVKIERGRSYALPSLYLACSTLFCVS